MAGRMSASAKRAFGQRLRQAREAKELDVTTTATAAGIAPATLRRWEAGKSEPMSISWLEKICGALDPVDVEWLVRGYRKTPRPANSDNPSFGVRLKMVRDVQGLTIEAAAKKAGLPLRKWRQWEDGNGKPNVKQFCAICNSLRPDPDWFLGDFNNAGKSFPNWSSQRTLLEPRR